jgi:cytochrome c553
MRKFTASLIILLASAAGWGAPAQSQDRPPAWAYPVNPPDFKPEPDDGTLRRVPDSTAAFTLSQLRDQFVAPDWHPGDHPTMPGIVAFGRKPDTFACGYCHRADGPGGPENAPVAGLPKAYIVQQMLEFKNGARTSSMLERLPVRNMIKVSKSITEAEIEAAATYFSGLKPRSTIRVVETHTAPKTYVAGWFLAAATTGEKEALGQRIIEVPEDLAQFESRDSRARFVAVGSIEKGKALVTDGGQGKTSQCGLCHGPSLTGLGPLPAIAGRSPSYIVRQLYDFQHGARTGEWSPLMAQVVANLSEQDLVSIAAYLASRDP